MQQIDWAGLVYALILLISAVTVAITIWNNRQLDTVKKDQAAVKKALNGKMDKSDQA